MFKIITQWVTITAVKSHFRHRKKLYLESETQTYHLFVLLITASSFFLLKFLRSLASPAYPPVPRNMEQVWRSITSFSRHAYEHALILSTKHCVVHSFISLAGVHSKVRTRCSEVGTEWLKSWNLFLVFRNKNLWSRNSVLGLGQADKPLLWKLSLLQKPVTFWT